MPDSRKHRGPHPSDRELFAADAVPTLRGAVGDFSWLLTHGYAPVSSLKLVGDRYRLTERQRLAVLRSGASDQALERRRRTCARLDELSGVELEIDGFNLLTTVEAALSGGVVLVGRDGCYRDLAGMHGSYRKVAETLPALRLIGEELRALGVGRCRWWLDSPVSNSGRLATIIRDLAKEQGWEWEAVLDQNPDARLIACREVVVSADSAVLDGSGRWANLARQVVAERVSTAWIVSLEGASAGETASNEV